MCFAKIYNADVGCKICTSAVMSNTTTVVNVHGWKLSTSCQNYLLIEANHDLQNVVVPFHFQAKNTAKSPPDRDLQAQNVVWLKKYFVFCTPLVLCHS